MPIKPKDLVVGRFWKRQDEKGWPYHRGYIDLGVLGKIMVRLVASPKRPGKQDRDADLSLVVDATQTPLGMLAVMAERLQDALYEDADDGHARPPDPLPESHRSRRGRLEAGGGVGEGDDPLDGDSPLDDENDPDPWGKDDPPKNNAGNR